MAELLGTITTVISLVQTTQQVLAYLRDVKDAPKECRRLIAEISSVRAIATVLEETLREAQDAGDSSWAVASKVLDRDDGPVKTLNATLTKIETFLQKQVSGGKVKQFRKSLLWPSKREDAEGHLYTIERQKSLLTLALENDHLRLSMAIQDDTKAVRIDVAEVKDTVNGSQDILINMETRTALSKTLNELSATDFQNQHERIQQQRTTGTGSWILELLPYWRWRDGLAGSLWCPGLRSFAIVIMQASANTLYSWCWEDLHHVSEPLPSHAVVIPFY